VPGPPEPVYSAGTRIRQMTFWEPESGGLGVGVSIYSYAGSLTIGAVSDRNIVADPDVLTADFTAAFDALASACSSRHPNAMPSETAATSGHAVASATRLKHSKGSSNDWFAVFPNARFGELFAEAFRALKRNTHLYLYCDAETAFIVKPIAEGAGFKFWKPLVWDKKTIGMGYHYRARYEFILFFEKGKRRLNDLGIADVITVPRIHRGYPAEKPSAVSDVLIKQSSLPGELVADPFMGSGSVGIAALKCGRRFNGCDLNPEAVRLTADRLRQFGSGHIPGDLPDVTPDLLAFSDTAS